MLQIENLGPEHLVDSGLPELHMKNIAGFRKNRNRSRTGPFNNSGLRMVGPGVYN
jgi:hypothetical protein